MLHQHAAVDAEEIDEEELGCDGEFADVDHELAFGERPTRAKPTKRRRADGCDQGAQPCPPRCHARVVLEIALSHSSERPLSQSSAQSTDIDLFSDESLTDPYPVYAELRAQGAAVWMNAYNAYVLTRYAECREALKNWKVFSSARGAMMNDPLNEMFGGQILLCTDGEQHGRLRAAVAAPLTTKALGDARQQIETEAESLVARLMTGGTFDAVHDLAHHLPVSIVSSLVGIPQEGRERMVEWGGAVFNAFGPLMNDYMGPALDTTINATSNLVWLFANHPDQWTLLRQRPELAANAINEVLRIESVIQGFSRSTTMDHELDGITIPAGSRVRLLRRSEP
jgi:cytochrome P450